MLGQFTCGALPAHTSFSTSAVACITFNSRIDFFGLFVHVDVQVIENALLICIFTSWTENLDKNRPAFLLVAILSCIPSSFQGHLLVMARAS